MNTAHAQRGGGMRMQQVSRFQLATLSEVESDTKLTADQKSLAKSLKEKLDAKRAEMGGGGGAPSQEAREQLAKFTAESDAEFVGKLDDAQKKRFNGLLLQTNGVAAVLDAQIIKELGLGEESVKKLREVNRENQAARREAMAAAGQGGNREEMMENMRKLTEKSDAALLAVLSDAEKKKMEELKGAKLEIDTAPLRQRRQ